MFLHSAIDLAKRVTPQKLLVRMDAGNDDEENRTTLRKAGVPWTIKLDLHRESETEWLEIAAAHGARTEPRPGKEVDLGETWLDRDQRAQRAAFRITVRTIDSPGQRLLASEVEIGTWWTNFGGRMTTVA